MNPRRYLITGAVAIAFAAVVWFGNPFLLIVFGLASLFWLGIPAALTATVLLLVRTGRYRRPALMILAVVAAFSCFVGLAIPTNEYVVRRHVAAAKAYPAQVAPLLEAYRQGYGSYPVSLDELPAKPPVPLLLRRPSGYCAKDSGYWFWFGEPESLFGTWSYDSETQTWDLST